MKAYCTYCSSNKDSSELKRSAIKRYKSKRITTVYQEAQRLNVQFYIFSGKFGLLNPEVEVPYYDHLLQSAEVKEHAKKVVHQIENFGLQEIVFFARNSNKDKNIEAYIDCLKLACKNTGVTLKIREYTSLKS